MNRQKIEEINKQTVERYNKRFVEHGPGAYTLGWQTEEYQRNRFFDLIHALEPTDLDGKVVLDIGCGLGDLYLFMKQQGFDLRGYIGIDINETLLGIARERYPKCTFEQRDLLLDPYTHPIADTGVMLGVMNYKLDNHVQYAQDMIVAAFAAVHNVLAVNAISDMHNAEYPREEFIYYYKPHEWLQFAQTLTPYCSLIHDYKGQPQHEFMLILRKQPWRTVDTH